MKVSLCQDDQSGIPASVREISSETGSEHRKAYLQLLQVLLTGLCPCSLGSTARRHVLGSPQLSLHHVQDCSDRDTESRQR